MKLQSVSQCTFLVLGGISIRACIGPVGRTDLHKIRDPPACTHTHTHTQSAGSSMQRDPFSIKDNIKCSYSSPCASSAYDLLLRLCADLCDNVCADLCDSLRTMKHLLKHIHSCSNTHAHACPHMHMSPSQMCTCTHPRTHTHYFELTILCVHVD